MLYSWLVPELGQMAEYRLGHDIELRERVWVRVEGAKWCLLSH